MNKEDMLFLADILCNFKINEDNKDIKKFNMLKEKIMLICRQIEYQDKMKEISEQLTKLENKEIDK